MVVVLVAVVIVVFEVVVVVEVGQIMQTYVLRRFDFILDRIYVKLEAQCELRIKTPDNRPRDSHHH